MWDISTIDGTDAVAQYLKQDRYIMYVRVDERSTKFIVFVDAKSGNISVINRHSTTIHTQSLLYAVPEVEQFLDTLT